MKSLLQLTSIDDSLPKRIAIDADRVCSIEEEVGRHCLVTYEINAQLHRYVKVKDSFDFILHEMDRLNGKES